MSNLKQTNFKSMNGESDFVPAVNDSDWVESDGGGRERSMNGERNLGI